MTGVLSTIGDGLGNAFQMAWEVWWGLILGFALSGIVQAWVSREQMERMLGGRALGATLKATGLGAASSSCSYAAIAIAKSVIQKGAGLAAAPAFMFASTNLVFELGIVLWIFLGPEFTAAEFIGGFALIIVMWAAVRVFISRAEDRSRPASTPSRPTPATSTRWPPVSALMLGRLGRGTRALPRDGGRADEGATAHATIAAPSSLCGVQTARRGLIEKVRAIRSTAPRRPER